MKISRTKQGFKNTFTGMLKYAISIILSFVLKTIFIYVLGAELLGLNRLFANILTILSLAELGVGASIVFAMYKPMAEEDYAKVNALVSLFKKVYFIIAIIIFVLGIVILPFIKYLINADNNLNVNIYILYLFFLANTVISYFGAHRKAIIFTMQRNDIENIIAIVLELLRKGLEITVILVFKNYYLFCSIACITTIIDVIASYIVSSKIYKQINISPTQLSKEEKHKIIKNIKGIMCHKIGIVVVTGTDNILISKFIGLSTLGIYSSYILIVNSVATMLSLVITAIKSNFGNFVALNNPEKTENLQNNILFIFSWMVIFCTTSLLVLMRSFVSLWLGSEYMLSSLTIVLLTTWFFIDKMRNVIQMTRDCCGLFHQYCWYPTVEAIVNLAASIILLKFIGLPGIILGTLIGYFSISIWMEVKVTYKFYYKKSSHLFWKTWFEYLFLGIAITAFTYYLSSFILITGLLGFILKAILCLFIPNAIIVFLYFRTKRFKYLKNTISILLNKRTLQAPPKG